MAFTILYIQELSIRLLEIFFNKIIISFTLRVKASSVRRSIKIKNKINKKKVFKKSFLKKANEKFNLKALKINKLSKRYKEKNILFFKKLFKIKLINMRAGVGDLKFNKPLKRVFKIKKNILKLKNSLKFKKNNISRLNFFLKKKKNVNKNFFKKKKFKIITKFNLAKSRNKLTNFNWVNRVYKLWSLSKQSYNSINQVVKSQGGLRSVRYFYKKGLKRCLKMLRQRRLKKTKFKSFCQKYLSYKNKPLRLKFAKSYVKFKKTRNFFKSKKAVKTVLRKTRRKIISKKPRSNIFKRKKFKRRLRRSRRLKNSLIRKKVYAATKDSRRLYRLVLGIRSKGKNRLVKSVKSLDHKSFYSKLYHFEMTLISVLLKTTLVKSLNDALFLIKTGLVFVNGKLMANPMASLPNNFIIQLPVSSLMFKWLKLKNLGVFKIRKKINRLRWYKRRVKSSRFKKKSRRYPKWLYKYSMSGVKIPISCELDLSTLSMISLYQPYKLNEFSNNFWRFINLNSHNVYLWKILN